MGRDVFVYVFFVDCICETSLRKIYILPLLSALLEYFSFILSIDIRVHTIQGV
jgi:hypothetical protein